jgi:hypothetical protein
MNNDRNETRLQTTPTRLERLTPKRKKVPFNRIVLCRHALHMNNDRNETRLQTTPTRLERLTPKRPKTKFKDQQNFVNVCFFGWR